MSSRNDHSYKNVRWGSDFTAVCVLSQFLHRFAATKYACEQQPSDVAYDAASCFQSRAGAVSLRSLVCPSCAAKLLRERSVQQRHCSHRYLSVFVRCRHSLPVRYFNRCHFFFRSFQWTKWQHFPVYKRSVHGRLPKCCKYDDNTASSFSHCCLTFFILLSCFFLCISLL